MNTHLGSGSWNDSQAALSTGEGLEEAFENLHSDLCLTFRLTPMSSQAAHSQTLGIKYQLIR